MKPNIKLLALNTVFTVSSVVNKLKAFAASALLTGGICIATAPTFASDIEMYKVPEVSIGETTLLFMLDTSGSMGSRDDGVHTRLEYLKQGMKDVLYGSVNNEPLDGTIRIGLATFTNNKGVIKKAANALGTTGNLDVTNEKEMLFTIGNAGYECTKWHPIYETCSAWKSVSSIATGGYRAKWCYMPGGTCIIYYTTGNTRKREYRDDIYDDIKGLTASGTTPTPYAYAEAAAYLLGTTTSPRVKLKNAPMYVVDKERNRSNYYWASCQGFDSSGSKCTNWSSWTSSQNGIPASYLTGLNSGTCQTSGMPTSNYYSYDRTCYLSNDFWNRNNSYTYSGVGGNPKSDLSVLSGTNYIQPSSISEQANNPEKKECSGQGIYFLTDGQPEPGGNAPSDNGYSGTAYEAMNAALGSKGGTFRCGTSTLGKLSSYLDPQNGWSCIGSLTEALLYEDQNPANVQIKTAVVGFGKAFNGGIASNDVKDAMDWGVLGGGGWTSGSNSQDIVKSVSLFVTNLIKDIPSLSTGSSVIPEDALNPSVIQNFAYFPQFEPKVNPADKNQVWFGNMKKYYVANNGIYSSNTSIIDENLVVKNGTLQDVADIWAKPRTYDDTYPLFKKYGFISQLEDLLGANASGAKRKLLTDYKYVNGSVTKEHELVQIKHTYMTDNETKNNTAYSRQLMRLLGYTVPDSKNSLTQSELADLTLDVPPVGAPLHSDPVLLTQSGELDVQGKIVETKSRQDYVLFGTTQGLVHIADAATGKEVFAFVPKEIIETQAETFKDGGGSLTGGKNALYYGVDGEWTAHSSYVADENGKLTVGTVERSNKDVISGHQWAYGGMRMGGRSYYALDLSEISSPHLKFHINPASSQVYYYDATAKTTTSKTFNDLAKMGQSWSKPTLGYVNWKGSRKLVMFVGGGYDAGGDDGNGIFDDNKIRTGYAGYEDYDYNQSNEIGSGVYMFDAENGDLLWKASANNSADTNVKYATDSNLKYSVVSPIHTVDRNNDGLIDHLYFGDLAGQAFRVDFANDAAPLSTNFKSQVNRILNVQKITNGKGYSPRFYMPPTFTAHSSAGKPNGANIVLATFVSGDKSSPLLGAADSPSKKDTSNLEYNGVFAVYDFDAYNNNNGKYPFYSEQSPLKASRTAAALNATANLTSLKYMNDATTGASLNEWGGWYYLFKQKMDGSAVGVNGAGAGLIKGLMPLIAMENNLYVSQFDPTNNGTTTSCGAGVKGHTFATRICLPQGICTDNAKYVYNLGPGNVKLNVGQGKSSGTRELIVPDPTNAGGVNGKICEGSGCQGGGFIPAGGPIKFIPNKWYEKYSRVGNG